MLKWAFTLIQRLRLKLYDHLVLVIRGSAPYHHRGRLSGKLRCKLHTLGILTHCKLKERFPLCHCRVFKVSVKSGTSLGHDCSWFIWLFRDLLHLQLPAFRALSLFCCAFDFTLDLLKHVTRVILQTLVWWSEYRQPALLYLRASLWARVSYW